VAPGFYLHMRHVHHKLCCWLVLALTIASLPALARDYLVFDVVGDSVSAGVNPDYYPVFQPYGWVHMLFGQQGTSTVPPEAGITNLWPGIVLHNSAVSGSKASEWVDTGGYPYMEAVRSHQPDLVAVMIGGNDFLFYGEDGVLSEAERTEYRTNLAQIVQLLRDNTPVPDIVILGYYDLFDNLSTNLPPAYSNYFRMSAATVDGNEIIHNVASSNQCFYLSIYEDFMHYCYGAEIGDADHLVPDYVRTPLLDLDIHPVTAGHRAICRAFVEILHELDAIPTIRSFQSEAGAVSFTWRSSIGQRYAIETTDDLDDAAWVIASPTNSGTPPSNCHTSVVGSVTARFYRIVVVE
jgi:lysophospholipase L1-like esterase